MEALVTMLTGLLILAIVLLVYFIPSIVANSNHKRDTGAIFVLNLFAGWSGIGWLIALVWACKHDG